MKRELDIQKQREWERDNKKFKLKIIPKQQINKKENAEKWKCGKSITSETTKWRQNFHYLNRNENQVKKEFFKEKFLFTKECIPKNTTNILINK